MAKKPWNRQMKRWLQCVYALGLGLIGIGISYGAEQYSQATIFRTGVEAGYQTEINQQISSENDDILVPGNDIKLSLENGKDGTPAVTMKKICDTPEEEIYNGDVLKDNGSPYAIKINRQLNVVTIYSLDSNGEYSVPVKVMRCSVGPDDVTPLGVYNTSLKFDWCGLFGDVWGQYVTQIVGNILFHSVPYEEKSKSSLETEEYNKLGTTASMGCIRLAVIDVKWIYENCPSGTQVDLFDSTYPGPLGEPPVLAKIDPTDEKAGWDPTDLSSANPWRKEGCFFGLEDRTIEVGDPFDAKGGVYAVNGKRKDVTDTVMVSGTVDTQKAGSYPLIYTFLDQEKEVRKEITITVEDTTNPVITAVPEECKVNSSLLQPEKLMAYLKKYVIVYDNGKELKNGLKFDLSKVGTSNGVYPVTCYAKDSAGNCSEKVTFNVTVDVTAPRLEIKDAEQMSITVKQAQNADYMKSLVSAVDDGKNVEVYVSLPLTVSRNYPYKVMYYAKDDCGNVAVKYISFSVK